MRAPYMRISNMTHNVVTVGIFIPNVALCLYYFYYHNENQIVESTKINAAIKLLKGPILPIIMFILPGVYYYRACNHVGEE